jgi:hypothetical protein
LAWSSCVGRSCPLNSTNSINISLRKSRRSSSLLTRRLAASWINYSTVSPCPAWRAGITSRDGQRRWDLLFRLKMIVDLPKCYAGFLGDLSHWGIRITLLPKGTICDITDLRFGPPPGAGVCSPMITSKTNERSYI